MSNKNNKKSFGVYIHWPFCAAKCPYCDFNSHVRHKAIDQKTYVDAYEREISHMASMAPGREVSSIFFGGGTPSLMEPSSVERIINAVSKHWSLASDCEISMEANPSSAEAENFKNYHSSGVNRMSLGIQSLNDDQLKFLGRLHNSTEAIKAIEIAGQTFDRISFDMIYARPNQSAKDWEIELNQAVSLGADHMSLYQLIIEHGTPFYDLNQAGRLKPLEEENAARLYELTQEVMSAEGFETYEISNHARKGHQCQHNLVYWRGQEYAGIGPGAHGRLQTNQGKIATATVRNPEAWWQKTMVEGHGMNEQYPLLQQEQADEFLLMGLRLSEGISPQSYNEISADQINPDKIEFLETIELIETLNNGNVRATLKGFLVLDAVVADIASPVQTFAI